MKDQKFKFKVYGSWAQSLVAGIIAEAQKYGYDELYFGEIKRKDDDEVYGEFKSFYWDIYKEEVELRVYRMFRAVSRLKIGRKWDQPSRLDWKVDLPGMAEPCTVREIRCLLGILKNLPEREIVNELGRDAYLKVKGVPADPFTEVKNKICREKLEELSADFAKEFEKWNIKRPLWQTTNGQTKAEYVDALKKSVDKLIHKAFMFGAGHTEDL